MDATRSLSRRRGPAVVIPVVLLALLAAGCTKSAGSNASGSGGSSGGQQGRDQNNGPTCDYQKYGAPQVDLSKATVGFSQSESTSNPFRATETESITTRRRSWASS